MPYYVITEFAGDYVAGRRSPGKDVKLFLSEAEAEHDLRVGSLRLWGESLDVYKKRAEEASEPEPDLLSPAKEKPAEEPRKRGK